MYAVSQDSIWVLVAADERVTPILAYSDANAGMFPEEEDMPDGKSLWKIANYCRTVIWKHACLRSYLT